MMSTASCHKFSINYSTRQQEAEDEIWILVSQFEKVTKTVITGVSTPNWICTKNLLQCYTNGLVLSNNSLILQ